MLPFFFLLFLYHFTLKFFRLTLGVKNENC
nr:MAG TPA: hypothetical protein [Caudoviricetes sp.]